MHHRGNENSQNLSGWSHNLQLEGELNLGDLRVKVLDQNQYLDNCPPTPPLTQH